MTEKERKVLDKREINDILDEANELVRKEKFNEAHELYVYLIPNVNKPEKIYCNMSINARKAGDNKKAFEYIDKAIEIDPNYVGAFNSKSELLFSLGDYEMGWKYAEFKFGDSLLLHTNDFENRLDWDDPCVKKSLLNRAGKFEESAGIDLEELRGFDYSCIKNKIKDSVINIRGSEGLGDQIQFLGYINKILEYNPKKLIISLRVELLRLAMVSCNDERVEFTCYRPTEYDYFIPMFNMMKVLGIDNEPIEGSLKVLEHDLAFAKESIKTKIWNLDKNINDYRIGFVFKGNPNHTKDAVRSTSIEKMVDRIGNKNQLFCFQYGISAEERKFCSDNGIVVIENSDMNDFYCTAGLMKQMDLIVSIDSSPAHLAGGLGIKSFCLMPELEEDYRWEIGKDCVWYKSMKVLRFRLNK